MVHAGSITSIKCRCEARVSHFDSNTVYNFYPYLCRAILLISISPYIEANKCLTYSIQLRVLNERAPSPNTSLSISGTFTSGRATAVHSTLTPASANLATKPHTSRKPLPELGASSSSYLAEDDAGKKTLMHDIRVLQIPNQLFFSALKTRFSASIRSST
jgi:hypothetical protein